MEPVRVGDRGAAVEDIQRRLRMLGYELGPTGIDGVFLGRTLDAVTSFQEQHGLTQAGVVDDATWSTLVDATFALGDRMLYLRMPHFHGHDVSTLQEALNVLGFACGQVDGIFGPYSENAVREFQRNVGLVPDGIAGDDSVRALFALRHIWEGKQASAHSQARSGPARTCEGLSRVRLVVGGLDHDGRSVAERLCNLAVAANPDARLDVVEPGGDQLSETAAAVWICAHGTASAIPGRPVVRVDVPEMLAQRLLTAVASAKAACPEVVVELGDAGAGDELDHQRAAVTLLDAICSVFD